MKASSDKEKRHSVKSKESKKTKSHAKAKSSSVSKKNEEKKTKLKKEVPSKEEKELEEESLGELPKPCKPIKLYVDNKEELIEQLFTVIHGPALQEMVPKTLKNYSIEELKKMCLGELESMSKGKILHILSGFDPEVYVEETTDVGSEFSVPKGVSKEITGSSKQESTDGAEVSEKDMKKPILSDTTENEDECSQSSVASSDALELHAVNIGVESLTDDVLKGDISEVVQRGEETDLELLELEMRARAIRSLLKARGRTSDDEEESIADDSNFPRHVDD